ncbi:hypothetical protein PF008_g28727 [Phytophthora fragariae]|uniref:Uncharacterized protein n=1 Tax=Phytophthora fragariae TaxID=53985 RepID=A0A6G0QAE6_9STRA|nr:hypothetical protein PF008_g28727 [Phytophthora fragariae]
MRENTQNSKGKPLAEPLRFRPRARVTGMTWSRQ